MNGSDVSATTHLENRVKSVKFTNKVEFSKEWENKLGRNGQAKFNMELFVDKHHHKITLKVNDTTVYDAILPIAQENIPKRKEEITIADLEKVKPGDILYVPSSFYIGHGEDDIAGGKAVVKEVIKDSRLSPDNSNYYSVKFQNFRNGLSYNLRSLLEEQTKHKIRYKNAIAHPDPDYTTYEDDRW
jgi:hypothetical protein